MRDVIPDLYRFDLHRVRRLVAEALLTLGNARASYSL